jgi:hypothetical protein
MERREGPGILSVVGIEAPEVTHEPSQFVSSFSETAFGRLQWIFSHLHSFSTQFRRNFWFVHSSLEAKPLLQTLRISERLPEQAPLAAAMVESHTS